MSNTQPIFRRYSSILFILFLLVVFGGSAYFLTTKPVSPALARPQDAPDSLSVPCLIDDPEIHGLAEFTGKVANGSPFRRALLDAGIDETACDTIQSQLERVGFEFRTCKPGQWFTAQLDSANALHTFVYTVDLRTSYWIRRDNDGSLHAERFTLPVKTELVNVKGSIELSVYDAIMSLGEKPQLIADYADVLGYDIDFVFEPRVGDTFRILVEREKLNGEVIGYGKILAAEYQGEVTGNVCGYCFADSSLKSEGWFSPDGANLQRAFMRFPLSILRVTSTFGMRMHPISGHRKMHTGTDYAAPTGTPAWTVASGIVTFAGPSGGYGNLVEVSHPGNVKTRYGHLSRILVHKGQFVRQRQAIGKVGSTGYSTGPHLHFETIVNGKQVPPRKLKNPPLKRIPVNMMAAFRIERTRLDSVWSTVRTISVRHYLATK